FDGGHRPFPDRRGGRGQSAGLLSPLWRAAVNQDCGVLLGYRHSRLGHLRGALAALCCERAERRRLGWDERRRGQRHRLTVVRPLPPGRPRHGIQWREHRRRDFSPLWVAAIAALGFAKAAAFLGLVMAAIMWVLADRLFSRTPQQMGVAPDGALPDKSSPCL